MEEFIRLCLEVAKEGAQKGEVPVGCLVVKEGRLVARAHNMVERLKDPTAHAEMLALREATKVLGEKYLYGCEVYVSLEPCPMCAFAMVLARVDRVVFLATDEKYGAVMSKFGLLDESAFNHRVRWEYVPVEEARRLIREFFRDRRL